MAARRTPGRTTPYRTVSVSAGLRRAAGRGSACPPPVRRRLPAGRSAPTWTPDDGTLGRMRGSLGLALGARRASFGGLAFELGLLAGNSGDLGGAPLRAAQARLHRLRR